MERSTATRFDARGRFYETLDFVETGRGGLATCLNLPEGDSVGGVVICSSLYNEFLKNYRREVILARELAQRGIAVLRFHYRGTGHSDGVPTETTLESMHEDAVVAAHLLHQAAGTDELAYVGTRFGSLVAAAASAGEAAPLAFLEPVVDASRFFREGLRTLLFSSVVRTGAHGRGSTAATVDDLVSDLTRDGSIDVLGYSIGAELYRSARDVTLVEAMGSEPRPVLLVQLGGDSLRADLDRVVNELSARGCAVISKAAGTREAWWFAEEVEQAPGELENRPHGLDAGDPVVAAVGGWVVDHIGGGLGS